MKISASKIPSSWLLYEKFIFNSLRKGNNSTFSAINGWQDRLFATLITYIIPLSTIAVICCIIMELKMGHNTIAGFDVLTVALVIMLMLNRQIPLSIKKLILIAAAIAFSLVSAVVFGYYHVAAIYLFGVSIFIAYQYSNIHAYTSVLANVLIWSLIGACIYYEVNWFPSTILFEHFIIFNSNLLFLNIITVIIIRQTLLNFERSVSKEAILYSKLQDELNIVDQLNIKLAESEAQYKTLFFLSPLPKWIYDIHSMMIVQVNNAAVIAYGYTKEELLKMSIMQLTSDVEAEDLQTTTNQKSEQEHSMSILRQLTKKNGDSCYVDLKWASFLYKGKPSRIVIASDITERVNHLQEIKRQNRQLQEIAYTQAHVLRSPLTKIMSLTELIRIEFPQFEEDPIFANLHTSTQELDMVIHDIIKHSEKALGN